eukprot:CAMPEP_0203635416 /NCGR_PEP_ID=MMETSP0088-20131115/2197_1 /ASSEMBLY_ACC=CAM_ASM_001087 /TAXON_ID=426623 /ORGANISM="Chaetoceros affinis, Strain CCMP159" /LENGTH=518 /DNA_ID=CAMNT_0050489291 /DNA_START=26 /DNA_END=1578 /DNA_ORIENTATION=-
MPSEFPSAASSSEPSLIPSAFPSLAPSSEPSKMPSATPSRAPTKQPIAIILTSAPTKKPTAAPSKMPSSEPSLIPSAFPTYVPSRSPSLQPSLVPSSKPSLMPTSVPSESSMPSLVPTVGEALIACASQKCIERTPIGDPVTNVVPVEEGIYGIRCCADSQLNAAFVAANSQCPGLWVSSRDTNGECVRLTTYHNGLSVCQSLGARLCTVQENLNDCTRPAKCSLNENKVWSVYGADFPSTHPSFSPVPSALSSEMPSLAPSKMPSTFPSAVPSLGPTMSSSPSAFPSAVPSLGSTTSRAPSAFPSAVPSLRPTISNAPSLAPSSLPSLAPSLSAFPSVVPTVGEALISCASQKCVERTLPGDPIVESAPVESMYGIRCCADSQLNIGFVSANNEQCPDLWVSSRDTNGECIRETTYHDGLAMCESLGARLCTVQENLNDCSRPAKCSLNENKVWTVYGDDFPSTHPSFSPAPSVFSSEVPSTAASNKPSTFPSAVPSLGPTSSSAPSAFPSAVPSLG